MSIMGNKKTTTMINEEFDNKKSDTEEMHAAMDDLCRQNQTLKDDVFHV